MEPESNSTSSPETKYKKTNILVVVFLVFSIIPALQSAGIAVMCVTVDVFAVLGIIEARKPDRKAFIEPYVFLFVGIMIILSNIGNLIVDVTSAYLDTLILAIYIVLVGISFLLNRWERDRKIP